MKTYKTIVIDGKKCIKRLAGITLLGILLFLTFWEITSGRLLTSGASFTPKAIIQNVFPAAGAANNGYTETLTALQTRLKKSLALFLNFEPNAPYEILTAELPLMEQVQATGVAKLAADRLPNTAGTSPTSTPTPTATSTPNVILEENQAPIKVIDAAADKSQSGKIILGNETSYSVNIDEMLASAPSIDMSVSGPKVLVIHTHATEAYSPEGSTVYDITAGDRSQNLNENVVRVGKTLCNIFNSKGIATIHDTNLHDYPSFNGSYAHSLTAIEDYLKQYPSIQVVFDIHRDSIVYSDNTKAKPLTQINGKDAAQLMFVVGTDEKGLYHPNWRENLKTAIHFQNAINQKYPTLMRHINLRQERFNGHTTHGSMIIETGSSGNTLSEAEYGLSLAAECIAGYLNELR
ncbi:MAG: stage II sporulation protein P [Clostridia bacterium]|nr:stage II sporulation protein P [Clostridia bacterium]